MKRKELAMICIVLLLTGCAQNTPEPPQEQTDAQPETASEDYQEYLKLIKAVDLSDNWTAAVQRSYRHEYDNGSVEVFDLDGVIKQNGQSAENSINIYADGLTSQISGWFTDGRAYSTYNGVSYYEDMTLDQFKQTMLVPLDMYTVRQEDCESMVIQETEDGTSVAFNLFPAAAQTVMLQRYDIYGYDQMNTFKVISGKIEQKFGKNQEIEEVSSFNAEVVVDGVKVDVLATTALHYAAAGSTEFEIPMETLSTYVHFNDIDTDAISDADITSDLPGDTAVETFKKRLISRLGYTVDDKGLYTSEFNDTESYTIDFEHCVFNYSNYTSTYVYNWKGDNGGFGSSCNYDFVKDISTDGCDEKVLEMIETTRNYFIMELYYCGLSLEELKEEL